MRIKITSVLFITSVCFHCSVCAHISYLGDLGLERVKKEKLQYSGGEESSEVPISFLPKDLMIDGVLSRLTCKEFFQFRRVSPYYRDLIDDPAVQNKIITHYIVRAFKMLEIQFVHHKDDESDFISEVLLCDLVMLTRYLRQRPIAGDKLAAYYADLYDRVCSQMQGKAVVARLYKHYSAAVGYYDAEHYPDIAAAHEEVAKQCCVKPEEIFHQVVSWRERLAALLAVNIICLLRSEKEPLYQAPPQMLKCILDGDAERVDSNCLGAVLELIFFKAQGERFLELTHTTVLKALLRHKLGATSYRRVWAYAHSPRHRTFDPSLKHEDWMDRIVCQIQNQTCKYLGVGILKYVEDYYDKLRVRAGFVDDDREMDDVISGIVMIGVCSIM